MVKKPDRLSIEKDKDRKLYNILAKEIFKDITRKDQFLFAMAFGYLYGTSIELGAKEGFFLAKDMGPEDEALLYALALKETDSIDLLANQAEVYRIAEQYAHGGIRHLHDQVTSKQPGSFYKRFEKDVFKKLKNHLGSK